LLRSARRKYAGELFRTLKLVVCFEPKRGLFRAESWLCTGQDRGMLLRESAMRGSVSWNRRGSEVTPNGYFTVLKSSGWFSTLPLPGGFRYVIGENGKPKRRLMADGQKSAAGVDATVNFQLVGSTEEKFAWARLGLIVLAAIALTFGLMLCCGDVDVLLRHR